jgi:DNA-directed RNA polymerase subunit RPC12/RpoP
LTSSEHFLSVLGKFIKSSKKLENEQHKRQLD